MMDHYDLNISTETRNKSLENMQYCLLYFEITIVPLLIINVLCFKNRLQHSLFKIKAETTRVLYR